MPHFIRWWRYRWQLRRRARREAELDARRRHPAYQGRILRQEPGWRLVPKGSPMHTLAHDPDIPEFVRDDK